MRRLLTIAALAASFAAPALAQEKNADGTAIAVFAGGCFWCMEPPFDKMEGVSATISGYTGGSTSNPTYEQVSAGGTGHAEALKVVYDPSQVTYEDLLRTYWRNVDPFDGGGQFCDRGASYRPAIFPQTDSQRTVAEAFKQAVAAQLGREVAVTIEAAPTFHAAEDYHQNYYETNPLRYKFYRWNCGRDARLKEVWEDVPRLTLSQ